MMQIKYASSNVVTSYKNRIKLSSKSKEKKETFATWDRNVRILA